MFLFLFFFKVFFFFVWSLGISFIVSTLKKVFPSKESCFCRSLCESKSYWKRAQEKMGYVVLQSKILKDGRTAARVTRRISTRLRDYGSECVELWRHREETFFHSLVEASIVKRNRRVGNKCQRKLSRWWGCTGKREAKESENPKLAWKMGFIPNECHFFLYSFFFETFSLGVRE